MTSTKAPLAFLGKWKLASCKSSRPDLPHPASGITTFTQDEKGAIHYSAESVWSTLTGHWEVAGPDGAKVTWETISERQ